MFNSIQLNWILTEKETKSCIKAKFSTNKKWGTKNTFDKNLWAPAQENKKKRIPLKTVMFNINKSAEQSRNNNKKKHSKNI